MNTPKKCLFKERKESLILKERTTRESNTIKDLPRLKAIHTGGVPMNSLVINP